MVTIGELKQVSRAAFTLLASYLDFGLVPNAAATDEEFAKLLVRSAFRNEFVNTVAKQLLLTRSDITESELPHHEPRAKALLYHLRTLPLDAVDVQFDRVHEILFDQAASARLFTRPVDVAIDIHDWPYYGSKHTDQVLICNKTRGTNRAYRFATICAIVDGVRFTLDWMILPANDWRAKRQVVRSLIQAAREKITIRHAYLDRGFYQVYVVRELKELDVEFIIRANPSQRMKDSLSAAGGETVVDEYEMRRKRTPAATETVTMFAVPHRHKEGKHIWFVTNTDVTEETVYAYAQAFRRRWGIETSYRKITEFLPKTSSPTFSVRLFYFSLATTLYNLWVLVNLLVHPSVPRPRTPPISVGLFQQAINLQLSRQESSSDYG
jgi:hypothetical protein